MQGIVFCHAGATFVISSHLFCTLDNVRHLSCTDDTIVLSPVFEKQAGKLFFLSRWQGRVGYNDNYSFRRSTVGYWLFPPSSRICHWIHLHQPSGSMAMRPSSTSFSKKFSASDWVKLGSSCLAIFSKSCWVPHENFIFKLDSR
jgi:hypothetical protein